VNGEEKSKEQEKNGPFGKLHQEQTRVKKGQGLEGDSGMNIA
jgi:hypothetical protein